MYSKLLTIAITLCLTIGAYAQSPIELAQRANNYFMAKWSDPTNGDNSTNGMSMVENTQQLMPTTNVAPKHILHAITWLVEQKNIQLFKRILTIK